MKNVARVELAALEQTPPISGEAPAGELAAEKQVQAEQIETAQQALAEAARPAPMTQRNFTDPESRIMNTADGSQHCDHAQGAVTVGSPLIVAGDVMQAPNDTQQTGLRAPQSRKLWRTGGTRCAGCRHRCPSGSR